MSACHVGRERTGPHRRRLPRGLASPRSYPVRPTTYEGYEVLIRLHIAPSLGSTLLADVGPLDVQRLYGRLLAVDGDRALMDPPTSAGWSYVHRGRTGRSIERGAPACRGVVGVYSLTDALAVDDPCLLHPVSL